MQQMSIHHSLLKKDDLANLKSEVNKLDIDELKTTPADLSKLSNVVESNIFAEYNELIKKVKILQATGTSNLVKKADYNTKIEEIENKIPDHPKYITTQELLKLLQQD